jgi:outer membrane lipoprotein-sorting protein
MKRRHAILGLLLSAAALYAADDLPKGEAILDKYVEATGGKAAYEKVKSDITTGTMTLGAMGLKGAMVMYSQAPDKRSMEVTIEGVGKIVDGSNGELAWSMNAMQGPRLKDGDEKAESLRQGRHNADVNWRDLYKSATTAGSEEVDGKDCYKVEMVSKDGKPSTRWYDKKTGLLVKMTATSKSPMGEMTAELFPQDYRKEGDLLMPHKIVTKIAGQEMTMAIDKVEQNVEIPKEKLEPPAEVKALIKK